MSLKIKRLSTFTFANPALTYQDFMGLYFVYIAFITQQKERNESFKLKPGVQNFVTWTTFRLLEKILYTG